MTETVSSLPLITGLDALKAWDSIEPICPLCALYGKPPSDGSAPLSGLGLAPIKAVGISSLASRTCGSSHAPSSLFSYVINPEGEEICSSNPKEATVLEKKPSGPQLPADFPLYVSRIADTLTKGKEEEGGGGEIAEEDASRLLSAHCFYSGECRWSSAHHEAELLAAIEATNLRMAEGRRHRNAAAGVGVGGTDGTSGQSSGAGGSNFAVAKMRSLVSQEKRRFQEDGFDLDLTYITKRIIAMGFPSYGKEAYYRNPAGEVERFFQQRHGDGHFRIYNLCSERVYDDERRFNGAYRRYPFDDHNAPCPISLIADFVSDATQFLQQHRENVVAIHCKAGKGRTGLMICCLLRATESNKLRTAEEALNFFGTVRTNDGQGVTIPSQHRYVHYWDYILRNWGGVPPPRAPPKGMGVNSARLATGPTPASESASNQSAAGAAPTGGSGFYRYIYLHGIVLDSLIFVGSSLDGSEPSAGATAETSNTTVPSANAASAQTSSGEINVYDISFTIEENNQEIFDSRKNTLVVPSRATPFSKMPHHAKSFLQPKPQPLVYQHHSVHNNEGGGKETVVFGNTKITSKDFTISTSSRNCPPPSATTGKRAAEPFAGYVFPLPTHEQLSESPASSPHRNAGVALRVAGDLRVTFYYKRQGLLGNNKESELMHFWINTFMAQHMTEGTGEMVTISKLAATATGEGEGSAEPQSVAKEMRCVRLGKRELDGVHKDLRHQTYCGNIGVTVYFTVEDPFNSSEIIPTPSAKAKALPNVTPTPTGVIFMSGKPQQQQQQQSHQPHQQQQAASATTATASTRRTDPNAPPSDVAPTTTSGSHGGERPLAQSSSPAEKKEEKSFFKSIFKF